MIVLMKSTIELTESERMELSQRATSRSGRADDGRRARLILLLEAGHSWAQIRDKLDCNDAFTDRWSKRFRAGTAGGAFQSPCRAWPEQADADLGGADPGLDAEAQACRWVDALEHAQAGFGADDHAHDGGAGLGKARIEAAAARSLHGFE
jgi:Homeodomain-like domain